MRASQPIPGSEWPNDMTLTIDDAPHLTFLLFVRSAWRLGVGGVPALESEPDVGSSAKPLVPDDEAISARWVSEWERAFERLETGIGAPDVETQRMLDTLTDEEISAAMSTAPSKFWEVGIDQDAFNAWRMTLLDDHQHPFDQQPERRSLPALIDAWKSGLTTIIQLPYAGYFGDRINREHLVVSAATRRNPELFSLALRQ